MPMTAYDKNIHPEKAYKYLCETKRGKMSLAAHFGVTYQTIYTWAKEHPEFQEQIQKGLVVQYEALEAEREEGQHDKDFNFPVWRSRHSACLRQINSFVKPNLNKPEEALKSLLNEYNHGDVFADERDLKWITDAYEKLHKMLINTDAEKLKQLLEAFNEIGDK